MAERHNLPVETTSFVGRTGALAQLKRLLGTDRLLTITGAGGSGKTRLALRLAAEVVGRYRDGVWLVEFASVADPALVPQAVARVLGVQEEPGYPLSAALAVALSTKQVLLVLDNCEHVAEVCSTLVETLVRESLGLRVLATSREPLRAAGEVTWSLATLALPGHGERSAAALAESEAVRLFVDRARARQPSFALTPESAGAIAEICARVDGIPLAIELTAALVSSFSVQELSGLLDDALPLLVHGRRSVARQATLRDTLDWSYALLSEQERILFRRLAVFRGGWGLEAPAAVCASAALAGPSLPRGSVPALLASLVEKSVVTAGDAGGTVRYRLLEPVRQYALELLEASGELAELQRQHARYFVARAEALAPTLPSAARDAALDALTPDLDNFRTVLAWTLAGQEGPLARSPGDTAKPTHEGPLASSPQSAANLAHESFADTAQPANVELPAEGPDLGLRLAVALFWYFHFRGSGVEARRWLELALEQMGIRADATAAAAFYAAGDTAWVLGEYGAARVRLRESVNRWRVLGDARGLAYALQALACALDDGSPERWEAAHEGVALFRQAGDAWGAALAGTSRGFVAQQDGDLASAGAYMADGVAAFQALGDHWFAAQILNQLGDVARDQGRYERATSVYAQALSELEHCDGAAILPSVLYNLGVVALQRGQVRRARQYLQQALGHFRDRGDQRGIAECLIGLGRVASTMHQPERAARLYGAAEALLARAGAEIWISNRAAYERDRASVQAQLGAETFVRALAAGRALSPAQMLAEALPKHEPSGAGEARHSAAHRLLELTQREREVATLVAQGYTNGQIAAALVITTGTAGLHVKHILHKLGYRSRAQVAAWATTGGFTDPPSNEPRAG